MSAPGSIFWSCPSWTLRDAPGLRRARQFRLASAEADAHWRITRPPGRGALPDRLPRPRPLRCSVPTRSAHPCACKNAASAWSRSPSSEYEQPRLLYSETSQRRAYGRPALPGRDRSLPPPARGPAPCRRWRACAARRSRRTAGRRIGERGRVLELDHGLIRVSRAVQQAADLEELGDVLTAASAPWPSESSSARPSPKRSCSPSARTCCVSSSARSASVCASDAASAANRRSDPAGSEKSHSWSSSSCVITRLT